MNHGISNSQVAAAKRRWAKPPMFESSRLMRAAIRVLKKKYSDRPSMLRRVRDLRFERTDKRQCLTWHHVCVRAANDAAIQRRRGNFKLAKQLMAEAKQFREFSAEFSIPG